MLCYIYVLWIIIWLDVFKFSKCWNTIPTCCTKCLLGRFCSQWWRRVTIEKDWQLKLFFDKSPFKGGKDLYQVLLGVYLCQRWTVEFKGIMQPVLFMIFFSDFCHPLKMHHVWRMLVICFKNDSAIFREQGTGDFSPM